MLYDVDMSLFITLLIIKYFVQYKFEMVSFQNIGLYLRSKLTL